MKMITSVHNEEIKKVASLHHTKYRAEHQQFIAEGSRVISTLLAANIPLIMLYLTQDKPFPPFAKKIQEQKIILVSESVMKKMSTATTPSGILAVFTIPSAPPVNTLSNGIVLTDIADPGNMGTLIRTAAALGRNSVVIVGGVDPWNPKVVQASAGTIGYVNIFCWDWKQLRTHSKKNGLHLIALVVSGGKESANISYANSLLVVGSEAHGVPEPWLANCDEQMSIPMPGNIESLNAAVAGSIALYLAYQKTLQ